ncbi:hypothetical protein [Paenibacillus sabinae]|uniref:Chromosome partitioning protein ParA n=1 Tax=Paenibacillus sabinae T27 TaxID=1268072 RepID=X4Z7B3_9BACL|nr:hypothetical protein [Paenibacillus sabinae]AHV95636.1 hypothetical protein PSAB_03500 [Paenibacillus sabinae T27]
MAKNKQRGQQAHRSAAANAEQQANRSAAANAEQQANRSAAANAKQQANRSAVEDSVQQANPIAEQKESNVGSNAASADREQELKTRFVELQRLVREVAAKEKALAEREADLVARELEAQIGFPKLFEQKFKEAKKGYDAREHELSQRHTELERRAEDLRKREERIRAAEIVRDEGYTEKRRALDEELAKKRSAGEEELAQLRLKRMADIDKQYARELEQRLESLNKEIGIERAGLRKELEQQKRDWEQSKQAEREAMERDRELLLSKLVDADQKSDELELKLRLTASREKELRRREDALEDEILERTSARARSFDAKEAALQEENDRLRDELQYAIERLGRYEELKAKLNGDEPERVLLRLNQQHEELKKLREELLERPTQDMRARYDENDRRLKELQESNSRLTEERARLQAQFNDANQQALRIKELEDNNKSLLRRYEATEAENKRLEAERKRLQASYEREQEREDRIKDIELPYFEQHLERLPQPPASELDWLAGIDAACRDYGLKFPKRILHAFHTGLKTSEWSPLTVLAGVSGTGKSELPRLYSHFGGFNYLPLAVQPNWDSQESMLGFFNSIDNKFDAQPVLRFLSQTQRKNAPDYPGFEDVMNLILLDEMNLAHIELYFAEFLSKLELRRGRKGAEVPHIDVKLGSGCAPYPLKLGRNVLWAGTMNQDETTKSLSDKVLDRGIVINFPRPTTFERRSALKQLTNPSPLLTRRTWESWWSKESVFQEEQIRPYKQFVEEINQSLAMVGRALGHRVWQSVEYYMANYPTVRTQLDPGNLNRSERNLEKAMRVAFEDQLVQKVMPKLRGIETRGRSKTECLDKIRALLSNENYGIVEDYDIACEFGYGQFMWQSANYIKEYDREDVAAESI